MTLRRGLLLAGLLAAVVMLWRESIPHARSPAGRKKPTSAQPAVAASNVSEAKTTDATEPQVPQVIPMKRTRREALAELTAFYRRDQLTRELDLEQARFGANFWEPEKVGPELSRLQRAREDLLKQLTTEANGLLAELFPSESGEAIVLTPIFGEEHPAPNVVCLSAEARTRFEAVLFAGQLDHAAIDGGHLLEAARDALSAAEWERFRQWNDPAAAALRNRLAGFAATEQEFGAILRVTRDPDLADSATVLTAALGRERYDAYQKLQDTATQTALHDLRRAGLPIADAVWLANMRTQATYTMQQLWASPTLSDASKREQITQLHSAFGRAIATRYASNENFLDGITLNF